MSTRSTKAKKSSNATTVTKPAAAATSPVEPHNTTATTAGIKTAAVSTRVRVMLVRTSSEERYSAVRGKVSVLEAGQIKAQTVPRARARELALGPRAPAGLTTPPAIWRRPGHRSAARAFENRAAPRAVLRAKSLAKACP